LVNFNDNEVTNDDRDEGLLLVGMVKSFLNAAGPDLHYYADEELDEATITNRDFHITEAKNIFSAHPIEIFYNFSLNIDDDMFMDVLLNNIRNEITSYQNFLEKFKARAKSDLIQQLEVAKKIGTGIIFWKLKKFAVWKPDCK